MYRFLLTPRWLALHAVALLFIPLFITLGNWQLDRFHHGRAEEHRTAANVSAAPVPLDTLSAPGGTVDRSHRWRAVTMTGAYDATHELLVRLRTQTGLPGFYVLTPLVTANGAAVLVNRGWVGLADTPAARPEVPVPPSGTVQVTGRIEPPETSRGDSRPNSGLPEGQITRIATAELAQRMPYPLYGGYVDLVDQQPSASPAPEPVPAPDTQAAGFASAWQNLAYVSQWWLFASMVPIGWIILVRREARDTRMRPGTAAAESPAAPIHDHTRDSDSGDTAGAPSGRPNEQVGATSVPAQE